VPALKIWVKNHSKKLLKSGKYHNLPNYQLNRLQQIQNSLARAVVTASKSSHITPILKSLHWFKVNERIEYKLLSLTYKVLTTSQPSYLNNLIILFNPFAVTAPHRLSPFLAHLIENHRSLIHICITPSLESTP